MQVDETQERVHNKSKSLINVYQRASKLFSRMTHSSRTRAKEKVSSSKSIAEIVKDTQNKHHAIQEHNACPVQVKAKRKSSSSDHELNTKLQVFYPVIGDSTCKRKNTKSPIVISTSPSLKDQHSISREMSPNLRHSSPLQSKKLHTPVIRSSSSNAESLSNLRLRHSLIMAFNKKLDKRHFSTNLNKSQLCSSRIHTENSYSSASENVSIEAPSSKDTKDVEINLVEASSDGTYLIQFTRILPDNRFGIYFNTDDSGYYISKQSGELQCHNTTFTLHPHDRILSVQGVPSKLLTPSGLKELLRGCHIMTIRIAQQTWK